MRVLGIDHVSVTCADLERSLGFYRDLLGLAVIDRGRSAGGSFARITALEDVEVAWADLDVGGRVLELLEYLRPAGRPVEAEVNQPGATHLALSVADIDAAHRRLREAGVAARSAPVDIDEEGDWRGARCLYVADPDGVTIELIERSPR